jgi:hypothetical protein
MGSRAQLWMADTERDRIRPLSISTAAPTDPAVSPDGRTVAFTAEKSEFDLVASAGRPGGAAPGRGDPSVLAYVVSRRELDCLSLDLRRKGETSENSHRERRWQPGPEGGCALGHAPPLLPRRRVDQLWNGRRVRPRLDRRSAGPDPFKGDLAGQPLVQRWARDLRRAVGNGAIRAFLARRADREGT